MNQATAATALDQPQDQHALTTQRVSLPDWQGGPWIALRDIPASAAP
ncbi:hypothetical protein [Pseudomonas sp. AA-38]|nr:hypothetical protein [Pseudomonas sp. AA-38]